MTSLSEAPRTGRDAFGTFYSAEIEPTLIEAEAPRRRAVRWFWAVTLLTAPALVVWVVDFLDRWSAALERAQDLPIALLRFFSVFTTLESRILDSAVYELVAFLAVVGIINWFALRRHDRLRDEVKLFLAEKTAAYFGLAYEPAPRDGPSKRFRDCRLVPGYSYARFEDAFFGAHEEVELSMVETSLWREGKSDLKLFQGLLIVMDFPKRFEGRTLMLADEGMILNALKGLTSKLERVRLEGPGFARRFAVYSDNQVEARYLLTPAFQERLEALSRLIGKGRMSLAFDRDELLIAVENYSNWFEVGSLLIGRVTNEKRVRRMAKQVGILLDIITTLNLTLKTRV